MLLRLLALFLLTYQYQYSIMEWIQQKTSKPAELKCCYSSRRLEEERKKREAKDQRDREEAQAGRTCPLLPENGRC